MKHVLTALALTLAAPAAFAQSMQITRADDLASMVAGTETFTGTAFFSLFEPQVENASVGAVTFAPGARSA